MIFKKLSKSYWFKSGSLTLLNRISITFFGLLNFIILVRVLSPDDFGTWVIFLSIITLLEAMRTTFMYNPLLRYLNSEDEDYRKDIISASLLLNLMVAVITAGILLILSYTILYFIDAPQLPAMLRISIISVIFFTFFAHFNFLQQADLKFAGTTITTFLQKLIFFSFILFALLSGYEIVLYELALVYSIGYPFSSILAYWFARKRCVFTFTVKWSWISKLFHYGKFSLGTGLSSMLNKTSKEWLLGGMIGTSAVAVFAPAARVSNLFQIPLGAIAAVFYPEMINRVKEEGYTAAKYLYEKSVAVIMISIVPCVIAIFFLAKPIVLLIAGPEYPASIPVLQVMILVGLFEPFQRQFGVTLDAIGKAHINFYFVIVNSIMAIIINYFSIRFFGVIGAAYGVLTTYALAAVVVQYILYKHIKVRTLNIFKYGFETICYGYNVVMKAARNKILKNG